MQMPLTKDPNIPPQPGSRQGALIGLQIFFIIVALLVYGLRVYTRRFILRSVGNDDYIMGIAVVWLPFSRHTQLGQSSSLFSLLRKPSPLIFPSIICAPLLQTQPNPPT